MENIIGMEADLLINHTINLLPHTLSTIPYIQI